VHSRQEGRKLRGSPTQKTEPEAVLLRYGGAWRLRQRRHPEQVGGRHEPRLTRRQIRPGRPQPDRAFGRDRTPHGRHHPVHHLKLVQEHRSPLHRIRVGYWVNPGTKSSSSIISRLGPPPPPRRKTRRRRRRSKRRKNPRRRSPRRRSPRRISAWAICSADSYLNLKYTHYSYQRVLRCCSSSPMKSCSPTSKFRLQWCFSLVNLQKNSNGLSQVTKYSGAYW
jgi:hypothetical protein